MLDMTNKSLTVGQKIRIIRVALNMNQTEFGEKIGKNTWTVSFYESDKLRLPLEVAERINEVSGGIVTISPDELLR